MVTGAGGAVGPELVRHLVDAGLAVRALTRCCPPPGTFPKGVELLSGDVADREFLRRALEGTGTVFHLAARVPRGGGGQEARAEYWRVNVDGTQSLVEACFAAGVRRLVYFSSIAVYGSTHGRSADEGSPLHPEGLYAETKRAAEEIVLTATGSSSHPPEGVVLRLAAIYGPRMKGNYLRLVRALSRRRFFPVGDGSNRRTVVFVQDAVRAALLAAQHPNAPGRIFNVSDGSIHTLRDLLEAICAALGRKPPRLYLPARPVRWLASAVDGLTSLVGCSFNLVGMVDKFVEDVAVRAERIQTELAFRPSVGLQEGWRKTIGAWKVQSGLLDLATGEHSRGTGYKA